MNRTLAQLLSGLIFGAGLALAGMTLPGKVLAFLDVAGAWDPSLLFVLGGAVITATLGYHWVLKRRRPLFDTRFHLPAGERINASLLVGSALFGVGWGISGYCPGPAIALLTVPRDPEAPIFLGGLLIGVVLAALLRRRPAAALAAAVASEDG